MPYTIIAIVGRPNVGKSSLFNRLTGTRKAIVHNTAGVTRDRNYGEIHWSGKKFFIIDTGGFIPHSKDKIESAVREQVKISIEEADIVLLLLDGREGLTPLDEEIASILRKQLRTNRHKVIIPVVNKIDDQRSEHLKNSFYSLGLGEPFDVSAMTGRKSGDLLDKIISYIPDTKADEKDDYIKIAIIGRPNAGKSSINNALLGTQRNIVTDIPGTTRDSIDSELKYHNRTITLIDTAGLRKKNRIRKSESLEYYSVIRTYRSIERCDVAVIVIDATTITEKLSRYTDPSLATFRLSREDVEIINQAYDLKKGMLLVINKWDLVEKNSATSRIYEQKVKEHLKTFYWLPFIFTSALTGRRVHKILSEAIKIYNERAKQIKTSELNSGLLKVIRQTPAVSKSRKEIKINYITQLQHSPPVIGFYVNHPSEIQLSYKKFLENKIRELFGFQGVPLTLVFRKK